MENTDQHLTPCASLLCDLKARNWSYTQIAYAVGMTRSGVCDILKGRTVQPQSEHVAKIRALHATGLTAVSNPRDRTRAKKVIL